MPLRVLLAEDEAELAGAIQSVLSSRAYVVDHVADGQAAWVYLQSDLAEYALAIVDWMLPGLSGLELCRQLRRSGSNLPVLMLTALTRTEHRVQGLDAGADDYLGKPFAMEELLARIRALQRRQPSYQAPAFVVGAYRLDIDNAVLTIHRAGDEVVIPLSGKELQLMGYFMEHPDRIVSGARLRSQLWSLEEDPISNVVAAQVRLLRRKFDRHGQLCPIETVPSRGYRFSSALEGGIPCPGQGPF
jgi:two-component system Ni(II)/redox-responsive regulator NrsR